MSKRRIVLMSALALSLLGAPDALVGQAAATATQDAAFPTSAELARRVAAMRDSADASQRRREAVMKRRRHDPSDRVVLEGVEVLYPGDAFTPTDLEQIAEGIRRARAELRERYGESAAALLDNDMWTFIQSIRISPLQGRRLFTTIVPGRGRASGGPWVPYPIAANDIAKFGVGRAAQILRFANPTLERFVGGSISLSEPDHEFYIARRALASSSSSVAQRCGAGVVGACKILFDPAQQARWFEPQDIRRDNRAPVPQSVQGSLLLYALNHNRGDAIATIRQTSSADAAPLEIIAKVAGLSQEALLEQWTAELHADSVNRSAVGVMVIVATIIWSMVFAGIAATRRPRV